MDVRAGHAPIRTEYAARAVLGLQCFATPHTEVKANSRVGRHRLTTSVAAVRTRDLRDQFDVFFCLFHSAYTVMRMKMKSAGRRTASRPLIHADKPKAPRAITRIGVKQHSAAKTVPTTPMERRRSADIFYPRIILSSCCVMSSSYIGITNAAATSAVDTARMILARLLLPRTKATIQLIAMSTTAIVRMYH